MPFGIPLNIQPLASAGGFFQNAMNSELKRYIDERILPLYDRFDKGHNRQHVEAVISQSLALAAHYDVDSAMVYTIAAYHDTGLSRGRELHHLYSGEILASDRELRRWFSPAQIETMREAVEDHRASSKHAPRSLYGRIVAEADRQIDPITILRRTVQYSLGNCPELDREGHFRRCSEHLHEKYAAGGYLKLWIPESENTRHLEELRAILTDPARLRRLFDTIFDQECAAEAPAPHSR